MSHFAQLTSNRLDAVTLHLACARLSRQKFALFSIPASHGRFFSRPWGVRLIRRWQCSIFHLLLIRLAQVTACAVTKGTAITRKKDKGLR